MKKVSLCVVFIMSIVGSSFSVNVSEQWFPDQTNSNVRIKSVYPCSDGFEFIIDTKFSTQTCGDYSSTTTRFFLKKPATDNTYFKILAASLLLAYQNGNTIMLHITTQNTTDCSVEVDRFKIQP